MITISYQLQSCTPRKEINPTTGKIETILNWYKWMDYRTLEEAKETQTRIFTNPANHDRPSRILKRMYLEVLKETVVG